MIIYSKIITRLDKPIRTNDKFQLKNALAKWLIDNDPQNQNTTANMNLLKQVFRYAKEFTNTFDGLKNEYLTTANQAIA